MERENMNWRLEQKKEVYIMAHRGSCGANIVDNTIESFELALKQGADILEMDVCMSTDGELYVFHDGTEKIMLQSNKKIIEMTSEEIKKLRYVNKNGFRLDHPIHTFDEVMEQFKGRCLINLDRCWWCWREVFERLKKHNMADQIIFKSAPEKKYLDIMEAAEEPYMYMPIIWYKEELERIDRKKINMIAVEVIGHREEAEIMEPNFVQGLRNQGIHCMISALTLANPLMNKETAMKKKKKAVRISVVDGNIYLAGGHDDDTSLLNSPDDGWGWLIDRGFDIIQTDWTRELALYLQCRKQKIHRILNRP